MDATNYTVPLSSQDVLGVAEQRLDDDVLLHHVEGEVLLRLQDGATRVRRGGRPHECGAEDDGEVGDLHAVVLLLLDDAQQVPEERGEGGAVRSRHRREHVLQRLCFHLEKEDLMLLRIKYGNAISNQ